MIWAKARLHWALFRPAKPHPSQATPQQGSIPSPSFFAHSYFLGAMPIGVVLLAESGLAQEAELLEGGSFGGCTCTQMLALLGVSVLSFN